MNAPGRGDEEYTGMDPGACTYHIVANVRPEVPPSAPIASWNVFSLSAARPAWV